MYGTFENVQYCIAGDGTDVSGPVFTPASTISDVSSSMLSGSTIAVPESFDEPQPPIRSTSFRPTFLVRTSDMTVVPGHSAMMGGYCALSYESSWMHRNTNDEAITRDEKIHTLLDFGDAIFGSNDSSHEQQEQHFFDSEGQLNEQLNGRQNLLRRRLVSFADVIQHLCRQFKIEYIWYDKMCIGRTSPAMERNELQQMHQIYGNAQYTLAIIPEMWYQNDTFDEYRFDNNNTAYSTRITRCFHQLITSQWSRRVWTFAEAIVSQKLVFVGRNIHVWSDIIASNKLYWKLLWDSDDLDPVYFLEIIVTKPANINVSTALSYVHRRQCSRPHDRIFTLANLFPEFIDGISFSYTQPLLQLITQFYRFLAAKDIAVLCFGRLITHDEQPQLMIQQSRGFMCMPSWTGVHGTHISPAPFIRFPPRTTFSNYYSLDDGYLRINTSFLTVSADPVDQIMFEQATERSSMPFVCSYEVDTLDLYNTVTIMSLDSWSYHAIRYSFGLSPTHQLSTKGAREFLQDGYDASETSTLWLSLTQENCTECIILCGVSFEIELEGFIAHPVVKRLGEVPFERQYEYYTAIGLCFARNLHYLYSSDNEIRKFTIT